MKSSNFVRKWLLKYTELPVVNVEGELIIVVKVGKQSVKYEWTCGRTQQARLCSFFQGKMENKGFTAVGQ